SAFFLDLARRMEPKLQEADQVLALNRLQVEHDNLRSALDWYLAGPNPGKGLELAAALFWFWTKRGYFSEGTQWYERALALDTRQSPALRAKALVALSHMAYFQSDFEKTQIHLEESLALGRTADDPWAIAFSLFMQAVVKTEIGPFSETGRLAAEAQTVA